MTLTGTGLMTFFARERRVRYTLHLSSAPSGVLQGDVDDLLSAMRAKNVSLQIEDGRTASIVITRFQPGWPANFVLRSQLAGREAVLDC